MCTHRYPSGDFDQFLNLSNLTLKYLHTLSTEFVFCGDFNVNILKDSVFKQQITLLFKTYNLFQSINFRTRIDKVSSSAIHNLFVDHSRINSHCIYPVINNISDNGVHYLVLNNVFNHHKNKK